MSGRTSWWAHDSAMHRRELIVELGDELGEAVLGVIDVLHSWAQEQGHTGHVTGGFRILARETFSTIEKVKGIVERAAELGVIDDLVLGDDGKRFTARLSGWEAEQRKARAAARKAKQREADAERDEAGQSVTSHAASQPVPKSALPHLTSPHITREGGKEGGAPDSTFGFLSPVDDVAARVAGKFPAAWRTDRPEVGTLLSAQSPRVREDVIGWLVREAPSWAADAVAPAANKTTRWARSQRGKSSGKGSRGGVISDAAMAEGLRRMAEYEAREGGA
jgi:hypothetical protein